MTYGPRFDAAVALAVADFRDIRRKGSDVPYITHLFAVTAKVGEAGGDEDQLIAAMLHDWLEDVPHASASMLEERFGARVARLVVALSDATTLPKPAWRGRKDRYLAHLVGQPPEVKLICCADKLHNTETLVVDVRRLGVSTLQRFSGGMAGTLWYYAAIVDSLGEGWDHWLLDDLRGAVGKLHAEVGVEVGTCLPPP